MVLGFYFLFEIPMEQRRAQKVGNSIMFSLPAWYCKEHGIKPGSLIKLLLNDRFIGEVIEEPGHEEVHEEIEEYEQELEETS